MTRPTMPTLDPDEALEPDTEPPPRTLEQRLDDIESAVSALAHEVRSLHGDVSVCINWIQGETLRKAAGNGGRGS